MWKYAPAIAAAIGAGLTAAVSYYPHAGWIPIALAMCTMLTTHTVHIAPANTPAPVSPATETGRPVYYGGSYPPETPAEYDAISAYPVETLQESNQEKEGLTFQERTGTQ